MKTKAKFMLTHAISADAACEFAAEVRAGLTKIPQRELPSKYLYDEIEVWLASYREGSASR